MNITESNIKNLTHLWAIAGKSYDNYIKNHNISYSLVINSQWPNRVWLNNTPNKEQLLLVKKIINNSNTNLKLVLFESLENNYSNYIEQNGFFKTSSLPGMSLHLKNNTFPSSSIIKLKRVNNIKSAKVWCNIFKTCFKYEINELLICRLMKQTNFYIAFSNVDPIGTVILHQTNKIAGIHSMGVLPSKRGYGYAKAIMLNILNKATVRGCEYATLQASNMAQHLYRKLGFKIDFKMNHYEIKQ
ncbi:GNAT family N-acetyltransferase [Seonamhaeicola algicola]|nr:GNAT family N-acetyltransferase [Seonamhaeicola algicola]